MSGTSVAIARVQAHVPAFDITFEVAGEAVAKGRPRTTVQNGFAKHYTPKKTRSYENLVKMEAARAMARRNPYEGAVCLGLIVHLPIPKSYSKKKRIAALAGTEHPAKRPDLDNYVKAALDGMNGVVFADDAQVVKIIADKRYSERPRLEVRVCAR